MLFTFARQDPGHGLFSNPARLHNLHGSSPRNAPVQSAAGQRLDVENAGLFAAGDMSPAEECRRGFANPSTWDFKGAFSAAASTLGCVRQRTTTLATWSTATNWQRRKQKTSMSGPKDSFGSESPRAGEQTAVRLDPARVLSKVSLAEACRVKVRVRSREVIPGLATDPKSPYDEADGVLHLRMSEAEASGSFENPNFERTLW